MKGSESTTGSRGVPISPSAVGEHDPGAFHVERVELDGQADLRLVGELDMNTADRLALALDPVFEHGVATLVLDVSELRFIDSSGLRQLVVALNRQRERGGNVVLHAPSAQTLKILDMVGMTSRFIIT